MNKKHFLLLFTFLIMTALLSACVLPATTAPSVQSTPKTAPTSAPPTLAIKTPVPTATKVASFQEILSGTQTALAIIRGGTPEEASSTPEVSVTEAVTSQGTPQQTANAVGTKTTPTGSLLTPQVSTTPTVTAPVISVFKGIPGVPTFGILKVTRDTTVTIQTNEFPANTKYVVKMGPAYSYALGGTVIGTFDSGKGGTLNETFNIPADLKGSDRIDIRVELPDGRYSYNYFFNLTVN